MRTTTLKDGSVHTIATLGEAAELGKLHAERVSAAVTEFRKRAKPLKRSATGTPVALPNLPIPSSAVKENDK